MAFNPTNEQKLAIETKGNVLVSAAAGSGKTAVLVERVMHLLSDVQNPVSADRMLIVTFTNAAAAEMRARIEKRMDSEFAQHPESKGLLRQKYLLSNAKICTIDSFCIDLVRENFEKLGINPDFKMSDKGALTHIDEAVIREICNEYIDSGDKVFLQLLDVIGAEYDERNFISTFLQIYDYSRQLADPISWFESLKIPFATQSFDKSNMWYEYCFCVAKNEILQIKNSLAVLVDKISYNEKAANRFLPTLLHISQMLSELQTICEEENWDAFYRALEDFSMPSKPVANGLGNILSVTAAKIFFENTEKSIKGLSKLFFATSDQIYEQFSSLCALISLLSEILIEYDKRIFEAYQNENTFTFHNTEHLALKLLQEVDENGENEFLKRYDVVMVDEYQDTNDLQDRLFYVLSENEKKLFAVGDIKQSIYGFRGANPDNFLQKKNRYVNIESAQENDPKKIILSNNFRSNKEICSFVNYFFSLFMCKETADLDYGQEERLVSSGKHPSEEKAVEMLLVEASGAENSAIILEALTIRKYIAEVMNSGECIADGDSMRKARYSDFAVLMRATRNKADKIALILRNSGIPVNFSVEGFAERIEIQTALSFLKIVDNPKNDIELACVMLSPIYDFTPDELAVIRANCKKGDFYTAVCFAAKNGDYKANEFLNSLDYYRKIAVTNSIAKTLSFIINESGYINMVSAMSEGINRRNNLKLLIKYASEYSQTNTVTISSFIKYIESQSESGLKASLANTGSDSVKIMSIHASKGLQFPICIVANTDADFKSDYNKNCVSFSESDGIGFRFFDEDKAKKVNTLNYEIMGEKEKKKTRSEELRLFYVAMTRAQQRLVFITTIKNIEKKKTALCEKLFFSDGKITSEIFSRCNSYSDWLLLACALHPNGTALREQGDFIPLETDSQLNLEFLCEQDLTIQNEAKIDEQKTLENELFSQKIAQNIAFVYPYEALREIEAKASVSSVISKAESDKYAFRDLPSFMDSSGLSATARGTAMHKIIQYFDFSKANEIDAELERLCEWKFISEREAQNANRDSLEGFFKSEVFARIIASDELHREMRFLTEIEASFLDKTLPMNEEKVILQGAVDLCFVENGELVILDFKTDRVNDEKSLIDSYSEQLNFYSIACAKIFNMPVKEKIIYSFALNKSIKI